MNSLTLRSLPVAAGASAVVTSLVMGPLIRALREQNRVDFPNHRSSHVTPTPRGGGLACAVGMAAGLAAASLVGGKGPATAVVGTAALAGVGYIDDRVGLPALSRLGAQFAVGAAYGASNGGVRHALVGALTIPIVVNSFNFMDGINGISAAQVASWAACSLPVLAADNTEAEATLTAAVLGAGVAFLPWNVPVARVFLGDVGSYLFGSALAFITLSATARRPEIVASLVAPYALYLADTGSTLARRLIAGESVTEAHRDHVYQQLVDFDDVQHWHVAAGVSLSSLLAAWAARKKRSSTLLPVILGTYLTLPAIGRWAHSKA